MAFSFHDFALGSHQFSILLEQSAVKHVMLRNAGDKKLPVAYSAQGPYVKSLPLSDNKKPLKNVPVKDLVAFAVRDALEGGDKLTEAWLFRTADHHIQVICADGNTARVGPDNLRIQILGMLDVPQPLLPRVCFAKDGSTICGAEATTGSHTCASHKQHEACASHAQGLAQLCVFRSWLFSKHRACRPAGELPHDDGENEGHHMCLVPTECSLCLARKLAKVDAEIKAMIGEGGRGRFKWAVDPMFALFEPRIWYEGAGHYPHKGCCLAMSGNGGTRFCLKPVWQHNGVTRLICMNHIVAKAGNSKYCQLEEAVRHHLANYKYYVKGQQLMKDGSNPFMCTDKFTQLMGHQPL